MGILNKLKHFLPIKTKIMIYNSLILSHLNFGILTWGFQCDESLSYRKKTLQILNLSKYFFRELKLLKL